MSWVGHFEIIHTGYFHRKGYLMLHHLASASIQLVANLVKFGPVHDISNNVVCATSKASDQPVHTCSLIRAFASRLNIL